MCAYKAVCVCVCKLVRELVFVPAASLLAGNAGNASGSDPTSCPAARPAHSRGTLMGSDGGVLVEGGWGVVTVQ